MPAGDGPELNARSGETDKRPVRLRFWIGLGAVVLIAAGSIVAAVLLYVDDRHDFDRVQRAHAASSARQTEAMAALSISQLGSVAAFLQAEDSLTQRQYEIIARPLMAEGAMSATAFIERVPHARRAAYERRIGRPIFERRGNRLRRAARRPVYYPITFAVSNFNVAPIGYDLGSDPLRGRHLRRAGELGRPVATPPVRLLFGGLGINVYRPVYRDGAPTDTVAQRRASLKGFAVGAFRARDLAAAAVGSVPDPVDVQIRLGRGAVVGEEVDLDGAARARVAVADQAWILVLDAPGDPSVHVPLMLAAIGISLASLLGALIVIWSRNERMEELQRQASQDPLTGLKNRRRFDEELAAALARSRRDGSVGAVLMIDLDGFKAVNDTHGHTAGDRLICDVAELLRRRTRESDVLARLGGDEFAVILPGAERDEARTVAESICAAIREHPTRHGEPVTASIGVATYGGDPYRTPATVISEADAAMYAAKGAGRDRARVFDPDAAGGATRRPRGAGSSAPGGSA